MRAPCARRGLAIISVLLWLVACGPAPQSEQPAPMVQATPGPSSLAASPPIADGDHRDDQAIAAACQAYVDLLVEIRPEMATGLGLHARDTELDDRTQEG